VEKIDLEDLNYGPVTPNLTIFNPKIFSSFGLNGGIGPEFRPGPGDPCVVFAPLFGEECYLRADVVKVENDQNVLVNLVDYGLSQVVDLTKCFPPKNLENPNFGYEFGISVVVKSRVKLDQNICDQFNNLTGEGTVMCLKITNEEINGHQVAKIDMAKNEFDENVKSFLTNHGFGPVSIFLHAITTTNFGLLGN